MTFPPSPKVRLTISVTPEVHATFDRLAKASNMSMSSAMGQWLEDTIEAADFMAIKCEQAKAAPKLVMAEMHAYAMALTDETGALMESLRQKGRTDRSEAAKDVGGTTPVRSSRAAGQADLIPPSGNTGGKGTGKTMGKPGGAVPRQASK